jgi:hypothetical protein
MPDDVPVKIGANRDPSHVDPDHEPGHEDDQTPGARPGTHAGDPGASGGGDSGGSGTSTWTSGQKPPPTSGGGSVVIGTRPRDYTPPPAVPPAAPASAADALEAAAGEAARRYQQHGSSSIPVGAPEAGTSLADLIHSAQDPSDPGGVAPTRVTLEQHLRAWDEGKADILEREGVKGLESQAQSLTLELISQTDGVQAQATDGDITGYATNALEVVMGLSGDLKLADGKDTRVVAGVWRLEAAGRGARTSDVADARSHKLSQWVALPLAGKTVPPDLTRAMKTLGKTLDRLDPTRPAGKVGTQLGSIADAVAAAQGIREQCRQNGTLDFDTLRGLDDRLTATAALLGRTIRGRFLS